MNKAIPFAQLAATLEKIGASNNENITTEQLTQIHTAFSLADSVQPLIDEIKTATENNVTIKKEDIINLLVGIKAASDSLVLSLGATVPEVAKAYSAKIIADL